MSEPDELRPDSPNGRDVNHREMADRELPERELLVAYLDGELDADEARRVEQLISRDSRVERELKQLEQAWGLLDRLPRAEVDPSFTQSTVEMVALAVEGDLRVAQRQRPGQSAAWTVALVAACFLGFIGARLWPDANRQLLRDLPVIDNVEAYRQTPQIDFLHELAKSGAFDGEAAAPFAATSLEERKQRFDSLDPEQKEELHRKYERFGHLPADEQDRLRKLEAAVAADDDAAAFSATLARFQQWLEQLAGVERAELMALDGEQRLERVKRLRREEARRLAPEDVPAFTAWFAGVFPKILPPAVRAKVEGELAQASEEQRPAILRRAWLTMPRQPLSQQARP
ncbi:MAG TPA: zf-HC2 domain-containing protein, partial [Pirellulales bacterium]|nr:zf-HC2 domain-containing protein [Pirellulales bacterium]